MAPHSPVRETSRPTNRRARGPSPSLTARHGIAFARNPPEVRPLAGRFRPDRWDPSCALYRPATASTYLPFGGGPHRCIGSALATVEIKTMPACLLRRTRLRLLSPAVTPTSVTAMRPRAGLPVRVL
ncbi:cytochrome P450 [Actinomadura bangladeshensis]|uniref:Cytochrome P450 n=1 Tax=Actinomadura bangladeshensis TaxID=453573 RepID=A0A4R4N6T3_9ACTN|nr:cytochrome P450 [Actinomadura bangladeshensis]TDC04465.1 cytochrome P450 [Actinomadura bangladeshensis]